MATTTATNPDRQRGFATEVVSTLRAAGFEALWAGGCVRDLLLGSAPSDYDVATSATPDQVMKIFRRTIAVGASFGVVRVLGPQGGDVEVATFRSDGVYRDGRHPESVEFGDARMDAERRDFTINGMFFDPIGEHVIDYVGGEADLKAGVLRAIGDPFARFSEDKLRLLRAVRFATRFGFAVEAQTLSAVEEMAEEVTVVSVERIAQELRRMLAHRNRAAAMRLAMEVGLLPAILPATARMIGLFQGKPMQPHGDLWDHTLLVMENLPPDASYELALAALLHDIGKPDTELIQDGRRTYHHHELVGKGIADRICRELKLSNTERERVTWLVAFHQYLGDAWNLRESKLKTILAMPGIEELLTLHRADAMATSGDASHVDYCETYLKEQPAGPINPPPLLTGHDLVRHGLRPGPKFAELLEAVREAQLDRVLHSKKDALEWLDRKIAE